MKHAIVILAGAADRALRELHGLTPLEAAATPAMDALAGSGLIGTVRTTPPGLRPGPDVCAMTLLGYDAKLFHTGRAPLEAAALGMTLGPRDWVFRVNFVTTGEHGPDLGLMLDHSAGRITDAEARLLARDLFARWKEAEPDLTAGLSLAHSTGYRCILADRSGRDYRGAVGPRDGKLFTVPPHEIPHKPWRHFLPRGAHADVLCRLMDLSRGVLADHEVNRARMTSGLPPATLAWIWGQGTRPNLPKFQEIFGLRGAITTAVDLMAGLASYVGWDILAVPGVSLFHEEHDYAAQAAAACGALDRYDLVVVHVETPAEASFEGNLPAKIAAIEAIDRCIVGPLAAKLKTYESEGPPGGGARLLVAADYTALVSEQKLDAVATPYVMSGTGMPGSGGARRAGAMSEALAAESGRHIEAGHRLMDEFLEAKKGSPAP